MLVRRVWNTKSKSFSQEKTDSIHFSLCAPHCEASLHSYKCSGAMSMSSSQTTVQPSALPQLKALLAQTEKTLVYNDFYYTNFALARDGSHALMFDYNLLGSGYAYADVRNVCSSLSVQAGKTFLAEYGAVNPQEKRLDAVLSPLVTLHYACARESLPQWAKPSLAQLSDGTLEQGLIALLG